MIFVDSINDSANFDRRLMRRGLHVTIRPKQSAGVSLCPVLCGQLHSLWKDAVLSRDKTASSMFVSVVADKAIPMWTSMTAREL